MELANRDEQEDRMLAAFLALWLAQRKRFRDDPDFWRQKEKEDRELLMWWLGLLFVASATQHGLSREEAIQGAATWGLAHGIRILSGMRRHTQNLLRGENAEETIFGEARARRFVRTEVSEAQAAGSDFAKRVTNQFSPEDLWFTALDERTCPYCLPLHGQPRSRWIQIYTEVILPAYPEFAAYGEPDRPPAHPNCRCFVVYVGEEADFEQE